jgi:ankyrin repeat protein
VVSTRHNETPLTIAALEGNLEITEHLLENNADVSATNTAGETPLLLAVLGGSVPIMSRLIDAKASVASAPSGYPPIWSACKRGRTEMVRLKNVKILSCDDEREMFPLIFRLFVRRWRCS